MYLVSPCKLLTEKSLSSIPCNQSHCICTHASAHFRLCIYMHTTGYERVYAHIRSLGSQPVVLFIMWGHLDNCQIVQPLLHHCSTRAATQYCHCMRTHCAILYASCYIMCRCQSIKQMYKDVGMAACQKAFEQGADGTNSEKASSQTT